MILSSFRTVQGAVTAGGQDDTPAVGLPDATLRCEELLGDRRSYTTVTHTDGRFSVSLPVGEATCIVTPTAGRDDLALRRVDANFTIADTLDVVLIPGTVVNGVVHGEDGSPTAFAEVRVLDTKGNLWGTALTNTRGRFETRVAWPLAEGG